MDANQAGILRRIKRLAARADRIDAELVGLMRQARDAGLPVRAIADAAGVTHQTVSNRIARGAAGDE